jgi:hypothetical protein
MKKIQFQQGDIWLEAVSAIPQNANPAGLMLAAGEHSNHGHFVSGQATVLEANGDLFVDVEEAVLRHLLISSHQAGQEVWTQEHRDIPLPKGKYRVIRQVEYNPYEDLIRQVQD